MKTSLLILSATFTLACSDGGAIDPINTGGSGAVGSGGAGSPASGGSENGGASGGATGSGGQVGATGGAAGASGGQGNGSGGENGAAGGGTGSGGENVGDGSGGGGSDQPHWVGTWATANQITEDSNLPKTTLANNTLRQIVKVSIGGSELRLRISNEYGTSPVMLTAVHVAKATTGSSIDTASDVGLTFAGSTSVTIPAQEFVTSDAFDFELAALSKVALSIAFGAQSGKITGHPGSRTTSYIQTGNQVGATSLTGTTDDHWYFISGLDVMADASTHAIAILGDSITDGRGSTTNGNDRWPDALAKRLQDDPTKKNVAVLNLGIGGNRLLMNGLGPTGLDRFESQILDQPGVKWVMVLEGVNDIGEDASSADLNAGFGQIVSQARAAGLAIYGIPILPFAGSSYDSGPHQQVRADANTWINTAGNFDAAIPMDAAVSNGANPPGLQPAYYDSASDKLHLGPPGYQKMADTVDLSLFE